MSTYDSAELETIQAVVDRVTSYQGAAPEGTVERELRKGLAETGLDVSDADVTTLADAVETQHGATSAAAVLG